MTTRWPIFLICKLQIQTDTNINDYLVVWVSNEKLEVPDQFSFPFAAELKTEWRYGTFTKRSSLDVYITSKLVNLFLAVNK